MATSAKLQKRRHPATGRGPMIGLRASDALRKKIDAWVSRQDDRPSRSEAIRRLVEMALASAQSSEPTSKKAAARASKLAGAMIDSLGDKSAPPEVQAKRKRRLLKGPPEFREMRDDFSKRKR